MAEPTSPISISELRFGSYLVYSPRGDSPVSRESRTVCYSIKQDSGGTISSIVERLKNDISTTRLDRILGADVVLVPAPRSAPLVPGALWPAQRIAEELVRHGLGSEVAPLVQRVKPVPRSSQAAPGDRPTVARHIDSLGFDSLLANPTRITIVDDVITKGRMLLATASLLARQFPKAELSAFALVRTMGLLPNVEKIIVPTIGVIRSQFGDANRWDDTFAPQGKLF